VSCSWQSPAAFDKARCLVHSPYSCRRRRRRGTGSATAAVMESYPESRGTARNGRPVRSPRHSEIAPVRKLLIDGNARRVPRCRQRRGFDFHGRAVLSRRGVRIEAARGPVIALSSKSPHHLQSRRCRRAEVKGFKFAVGSLSAPVLWRSFRHRIFSE